MATAMAFPEGSLPSVAGSLCRLGKKSHLELLVAHHHYFFDQKHHMYIEV